MVTTQELYTHLMNLINLQFYNKTESDNKYVQFSSTNGLLKNDGTVDTTSYSTFSGDYSDLTNKPTIPTDVVELDDDTHIIPTSTSDLTNDGDGVSAFATTNDLTGKENTSNKESSITASNSVNQNKYASTKAVADYALQKDIPIESTDSLNDLYKPGFYRCSKSKAVQSELPSGFSSAYSLIVIATGVYISLAQPYTNIYQLLIGDEIIYMREGILSSSNTMTVTTGWKRLNYDVDTTNGGTSGSSNLITSGAVYSGLSGKSDDGHTHTTSNITDFPSIPSDLSDLTDTTNVVPLIADNLTTNDSSKVLSAKQGKVLNDLIGNAISYINQ